MCTLHIMDDEVGYTIICGYYIIQAHVFKSTIIRTCDKPDQMTW